MSTESFSALAAAQYPYAAPATYFPVPFHLQNAYTATDQQYAVAAVPPAVYPAPVYPLPQYQQAHQLFQRDAQIVTPEALASVKAAIASTEAELKVETKKKAIPRKAAGQTWEDPTLADWPESDVKI